MIPTSTRSSAPKRAATLRRIGAIALAAAAVFGYQRVVSSAEPMRTVPAPTLDETPGTSHEETAVIAGGCFWGVQGVFEHVKGVKQVTYGRLLQVFFSVAHDPTELNRQGPDEGSQYRSAIFPTTAQQRAVATAYIAQLGTAHTFASPVVTRVEPYKGFYPAEAYHQNYLELHPDAPYIAYNDMPKVAGLKQRFPALYRPDAVLWRDAHL